MLKKRGGQDPQTDTQCIMIQPIRLKGKWSASRISSIEYVLWSRCRYQESVRQAGRQVVGHESSQSTLFSLFFSVFLFLLDQSTVSYSRLSDHLHGVYGRYVPHVSKPVATFFLILRSWKSEVDSSLSFLPRKIQAHYQQNNESRASEYCTEMRKTVR